MVLTVSAVLFPILAGIILFLVPIKNEHDEMVKLNAYQGVVLIISAFLALACIIGGSDGTLTVLKFNEILTISFHIDSLGKFFAFVMTLVWVLVGFFGFEYLKHEKNVKRYISFYIMVLGILYGLCFAGNLTTYYAFYELMTIASFGLVLHNQSKEAVMAGLKYLFYSFAGAYSVLFGFYFVSRYTTKTALTFTEGGIIDIEKAISAGALNESATGGILMVAMLAMLLGFSVKAGMFPMHGWLPTAHPVAPAPASAALSAIIVKSGVLGIIRVVYYIFGVGLFVGSFVQKTVLVLSLITVFMGSMLAYKEKVLKKRLAYSTVSQVSYILFGIFVINETAFKGAMIHVAAHATIKSSLFLCAGAIIYLSGRTKVDELRGIGRKMPIMLICYTIVSLGLIGIPPFGGFTSKWFLCIGALDSGISIFAWLGPVVLLVSALLTAGYLLPITINGFFPGADFDEKEVEAFREPKLIMLVPIIILTVCSMLVGMFPEVIAWM